MFQRKSSRDQESSRPRMNTYKGLSNLDFAFYHLQKNALLSSMTVVPLKPFYNNDYGNRIAPLRNVNTK